jgi:hypothetical protein
MDVTITIGGTGTYTSVGACASGTAAESRYAGSTGKTNSALALDGTNDFATITDTSALRFNSSTQDFSVFAWIKKGANGSVQYILSKEDADNDGYRLQFNADNTITCSVNAADITSTATITDTSGWHLIGCTINRSGNGQVYIDGNPSGSAVATSGITLATTANLIIGARSYTIANYFNGLIDDLKIYNYSLTPIQVRSLLVGGALNIGPTIGSAN